MYPSTHPQNAACQTQQCPAGGKSTWVYLVFVMRTSQTPHHYVRRGSGLTLQEIIVCKVEMYAHRQIGGQTERQIYIIYHAV